MAHILPHWTWPERVGQVTPVHVFTSGDEAELFLNGVSLGRKKKGPYQYRLRWDDVVYQPGQLSVRAYKNGRLWATDEVNTAGQPVRIELVPDRSVIQANGEDLCFITAKIVDSQGIVVPRADNLLAFTVKGPGILVATDNGDPTNMVAFPSHQRRAFNGFCLVIVRGISGQSGIIEVQAESELLQGACLTLQSRSEKTR